MSAEAASEAQPIFALEHLEVDFATEEGTVHAVRGVSLDVWPGETLGVVGESGSGKSVSMLAALGLLPQQATIRGSATFDGVELTGRGGRARQVRGRRVAMIFQDPLTALNPVLRVGDQIGEAIRADDPGLGRRAVRERAVTALDRVGIPQPEVRARQYPHELSGGMRQRAMIALAISNGPDVIIADEPTTALDVTIQAQILELLQELQHDTRAALILITHDLGVIARMAHRVTVMYAGRVVEQAPIEDLFARPSHPYTKGLLESIPDAAPRGSRLQAITGAPPSMLEPPPGCAFHPRCPHAVATCRTLEPVLRPLGAGEVSCHLAPIGDR